MHYYNMQSDQIAEMHARIRELEEVSASAELSLEAAMDEIEEGRERERRLACAVIGFATVAMLAILEAGWLAMGR